jgi:hypothetical protein
MRSAAVRKSKSLADEFGAVDVPFIPGKRVRIFEGTPVPYDSNPRRLFKLWVDEVKYVVMWIQYPLREIFLCDEHGSEDCEHKQVVRRFMEAGNAAE